MEIAGECAWRKALAATVYKYVVGWKSRTTVLVIIVGRRTNNNGVDLNLLASCCLLGVRSRNPVQTNPLQNSRGDQTTSRRKSQLL